MTAGTGRDPCPAVKVRGLTRRFGDRTVLDGIDIASVYAHPGGGVVQPAPFTLACYWSVAGRRGIPLAALTGTSQADFFLTYLGCITKQQIPTSAGLRLNLDTIEFCMDRMPRWTPVSIAGYNGADSGLNGYQELGAVMANAVEYLDGLAARSISVGRPILAPYGRVKLAEPESAPMAIWLRPDRLSSFNSSTVKRSTRLVDA